MQVRANAMDKGKAGKNIAKGGKEMVVVSRNESKFWPKKRSGAVHRAGIKTNNTKESKASGTNK